MWEQQWPIFFGLFSKNNRLLQWGCLLNYFFSRMNRGITSLRTFQIFRNISFTLFLLSGLFFRFFIIFFFYECMNFKVMLQKLKNINPKKFSYLYYDGRTKLMNCRHIITEIRSLLEKNFIYPVPWSLENIHNYNVQ